MTDAAGLVPFDLITSLTNAYQDERRRIDLAASFLAEETGPQGVVRHFLAGNVKEDRGVVPNVATLFKLEGAVAALNSHYWQKAIELTDVLTVMPQARRDEWHEQIRKHQCPEFSADTVKTTLGALLAQRAQFLGERVDGIFRGLSGEHVTNQPQGFSKRMIIAGVIGGYGTAEHRKTGLINDLRAVIAKLTKRGDEPSYLASDGLVKALRGNWGEWVDVDGGALRIRLYRKGTAHMEVHPDIAWQLNRILAHLYPRAIPPEFRERPKRQPKDVPLMQRPLPFAVIEMLADLGPAYDWNRDRHMRHTMPNARAFPYSACQNKHAFIEAKRVLESLGAVETKHGWQFDYEPSQVLQRIVASGVVPDDKAHQFYPTPEHVAQAAVEWAEIGEGHMCLEPSAGLGALVQHMPKHTICIEVSALRADVLKAKGYPVECRDFLAFKPALRPDRIVMNPPFDQGRWQAHLSHARSLLASGGVLVAILPLGARGKVDGAEFGQVFEGEFSGTSVDVVLCRCRA